VCGIILLLSSCFSILTRNSGYARAGQIFLTPKRDTLMLLQFAPILYAFGGHLTLSCTIPVYLAHHHILRTAASLLGAAVSNL
jgi:hypothetical protein